MKLLLLASLLTVVGICIGQYPPKAQSDNLQKSAQSPPDSNAAFFMRRIGSSSQSSSGSGYNYNPGSTASNSGPSENKFNGYPGQRDVPKDHNFESTGQTQSSGHSNNGGYPRQEEPKSKSQGFGSNLSSHSLTEMSSSNGYVRGADTAQAQFTSSGKEEYSELSNTMTDSIRSQFRGNSPAMNHMDQNQFSQSAASTAGSSRNGNQFTGYPERQDSNNEVQHPAEKEGPRSMSQVQIQRHIYFHAAPEDPPVQSQPTMSGGVTKRKHYTIIFIDTSRLTKPPPQQQAIQSSKNEEKTIVYVLVKKPDEQSDSGVAQKPSSPLSKPEVFFINYKEGSKSKTEIPENKMDQKQEGDAPYPPKMEPPNKQKRQLYF